MELTTIKDFEQYALDHLGSAANIYYAAPAVSGTTYNENITAYQNYKFRPRYLRDVRHVCTELDVQGHKTSLPIGFSPTAHHIFAHPLGEKASASSAEAENVIMIVSLMSDFPMEDIAKAAPNATLWQQFYILADEEVMLDLLRRAEQAGVKAIVLTVDQSSWRKHECYDNDDIKELFSKAKYGNFQKYIAKDSDFVTQFMKLMPWETNYASWDQVTWLKSQTRLPIIVKGLMTAEDAVLAIERKVDGILVSNHGGRHMDGLQGTLDALPAIVKSVDGKVDVYVDGGIRSGQDVFKALALGAKMVFVGRPILWGLAYDGAKGVSHVLDILKSELKYTMQLTGCTNTSEITDDYVIRTESISKL